MVTISLEVNEIPTRKKSERIRDLIKNLDQYKFYSFKFEGKKLNLSQIVTD